MVKNQIGFTLIELMIVVAIIGILASIAIPSYQNYVKKTYVLEGINLSTRAKTAIWDYWSVTGIFPSNNASAGLLAIQGDAVDSVTIANNTITITYNNKVQSNKTIILQVNNTGGSLVWDCTAGSLNNKYRPINCRNL
ncbi:MAG: pilin [Thiotrichaceae bacterium]|nr:pilin [Thiotrichaceae bacterium]